VADAIGTALYGALAASTALVNELGGTAIWRDVAPRGAALPYVIISLLAATEENYTPLRSERRIYLVKGVAETLAKAQDIAADIDTALHSATLSASGYANFWTMRQTLVSYIETDPAGAQYGHAGGQYVVRVERT
jgi:hypothetical protein